MNGWVSTMMAAAAFAAGWWLRSNEEVFLLGSPSVDTLPPIAEPLEASTDDYADK